MSKIWRWKSKCRRHTIQDNNMQGSRHKGPKKTHFCKEHHSESQESTVHVKSKKKEKKNMIRAVQKERERNTLQSSNKKSQLTPLTGFLVREQNILFNVSLDLTSGAQVFTSHIFKLTFPPVRISTPSNPSVSDPWLPWKGSESKNSCTFLIILFEKPGDNTSFEREVDNDEVDDDEEVE